MNVRSKVRLLFINLICVVLPGSVVVVCCHQAWKHRESSQALNELSRGIKDGDWELCRRAIVTIERNNLDVVATIKPLLHDDDWHVRHFALTAVVQVKQDEGVIPALIELLRDSSLEKRRDAAFFLGGIAGYPNLAVPSLIAAADDESISVRAYAVRALGEFGFEARQAVPALLEHLVDDEPLIRELAIQSLGRIGPEAEPALPMLRKLVEGKDQELQFLACQAIERICGGSRHSRSAGTVTHSTDEPVGSAPPR